MNRKSIATLMVVGALSAVAVLGAFTYRTVYAQEPTPTQTPATETGTLPSGKQDRGARGDRDGGMLEQDLADALGVDLATLQAAKQTASEQALQQAVDQGLITQEQADQMQERGVNGRGRLPHGVAGIDYDALLASALGISVEELQAAQAEAQQAALDRAVTEGRISAEEAAMIQARQALYTNEDFQSTMQSAFESAVQQAVSNGVITQEQADQILTEQAGKSFFGHGRGMGGRGHGH